MPDPRKNLIQGRVRAFASCGASAQRLLLENGAWTQLDSWFRTGVANKDTALLRTILEVVLSMPTSWSELQKQTGGLPLSVETLLKQMVHGQLKDWADQKEVRILKELMLDVFVKWLKIKKRNWEEPEDKTRLVVEMKDTGEKGAIALIEGRPGWGFLMVGGKIKLLEVMEEVDDGHGQGVESGVKNKVAKLTEKSRGDNLLEEMITPLPVPPSKVEEEEEEPEKMEEDKMDDLMEDVLDEATCKVLDNLRIEETLGVPKKLVRWWGVDGVKELCEYPAGEYSREGYEKEKWVSIEFEDEEDEDEVDNGHGGRWNLRKIHFDKIPGFINLEVNSTEVEVQRRRELEVKRWVEEQGGGRDTPFEEDVDKEGDEEDDSSDIFKIVEEVTTEDVIEGMETDTLVFDRRLEVWPEPKKAKRFLGNVGRGIGRRWGKERRFKVLNQNGNNVNGKMNGGK